MNESELYKKLGLVIKDKKFVVYFTSHTGFLKFIITFGNLLGTGMAQITVFQDRIALLYSRFDHSYGCSVIFSNYGYCFLRLKGMR